MHKCMTQGGNCFLHTIFSKAAISGCLGFFTYMTRLVILYYIRYVTYTKCATPRRGVYKR